MHAAAKFLLELGVQDYRLVACPPSLQVVVVLVVVVVMVEHTDQFAL